MGCICTALEVLQICINYIHNDYHSTGSSRGHALDLQSEGAQFDS
jgi:hypothetical protein